MEDQRRDLQALPKAHVHLHFTGSLDVDTLQNLAAHHGIPLPPELTDREGLKVPDSRRGWFKFQRHYDLARRAVKGEHSLRTVVRSAAEREARQAVRRLELQLDPTSYAPSVGGLHRVLDVVCDEARVASAATGVDIGIIVASSRLRHPLDARTLARLAAQYAGDGAGEVVAFGLNNDEEVGDTAAWEGAFRIARAAGLKSVPHGGELRGPEHVRDVVDYLQPDRIGHGVRTVESPELLQDLVAKGIAFEVCPASNVSLGIYDHPAAVPLRQLLDAGAHVALGADDPLLFLSDLTDQYRIARDDHGLTDAELARLAQSSIDASFATPDKKSRWAQEINDWLATEAS
ncbi:Hermansky-Pudlak syndrome 5 protein [Platysternon megacephalum]|uniref:Adenosine deaminase n=1 Tax=Platysternon megacephalum TaxID=55544 RepID=A0A4D9DBV7_9SAUR|nr:Hermansky-Pudlak syndrome 5 protein [Platysternon megacephalum]